MGWAEINDVRTLVYTAEADAKVQAALDSAKDDIMGVIGSFVGEPPITLKNAHKYLAAVNLIHYMITNGELAYFNKIGPDQTYNKPEETLAFYQKKYEQAMAQYGYTTGMASLYTVIRNAEDT